MAHARTTFWQNAERANSDETLRSAFQRKLGVVFAQVPFVEDLLCAYYCAFDRATPVSVKAALIGALAYFVLPLDSVPDFIAGLGYTDDAAVLAGVYKLISSHIRPEHREAARDKVDALKNGG